MIIVFFFFASVYSSLMLHHKSIHDHITFDIRATYSILFYYTDTVSWFSLPSTKISIDRDIMLGNICILPTKSRYTYHLDFTPMFLAGGCRLQLHTGAMF